RDLVKTKSGEKRNTYDEILNARKYKEMTTWKTRDEDDEPQKKSEERDASNVKRQTSNSPPREERGVKRETSDVKRDTSNVKRVGNVRRNVPSTDDKDEIEARKLGAARSSFQEKPKSTRATEWKPGDKVTHPTFGDGTVVSSKIVGNDEELQVAFEGAGVKRLLAAYAKLTRR
ncbi:MAG: hypothetical protein HY741_11535, partial [Chloroflexi bacterium]|nr:hypothetical protein [Chloroflexota bacterium]